MIEVTDRLDLRLLVLRCQLGDQQALASLVSHFQPRLRGFVFKMLPRAGGGQSLDDLMQDIWADVLRELPRLANAGAFAPWLYRIARNRVARMYRQRDRPSLPVHEVDIADGRDTDDRFTATDAAAVHDALGLLPPDQREVLLLRFMEDMGYDDIAGVAGCPVGTVRSRLHNGKRALRAILERQAGHVTG